NGYRVYLVDEFRTSCRCAKCEGGECKKFKLMPNPKPSKDNLRLVHGLLRCKNCANVWNRDCNGAKNIYKIAYNAINGIERPDYLCRGLRKKDNTKKVIKLKIVNNSDILQDISKSQFTRSETVKLIKV